jgi:hypothetical protein
MKMAIFLGEAGKKVKNNFNRVQIRILTLQVIMNPKNI